MRSRLWRHPDFAKLLTGQAVSQLGTQISLVALPLTAISVLHASALQMGALAALEYLPFVLLGLPAGAWVDRTARRPVLVISDIGRLLALGSIPLAFALGVLGIGQLFLVALVCGTFTVFFDVAYQSYLPSLVSRDELVAANATLEAAYSGARLAGPGLAGWLVAALSGPAAILADAASYVVSAASLVAISTPETRTPPRPGSRLRTEIAEGFDHVARHPVLRPLALATGSGNLFGAMIQAILLLFAIRTLGLSPAWVGAVLTAESVGFLGGAALSTRASNRLGDGPAIIWAASLLWVASLLTALATRRVAIPVLALSSLLLGLGGAVYNIVQVSLRQRITPDALQGRMNATMRFIGWGAIPLGSLLGGALGGAIGLRPTLVAAAAGELLAILVLLLSPLRSSRTPAPAPHSR